MPNTYPLNLTQLESLYLSDSLSMFTQGAPDALPGQASPYPNLLLKIGGAVLETTQKGATVTIHLSLPELWMIREVAKSSVVVGSERVGLNLLVKVYEAIRTLTAETDMMSLVNDYGEVTDDEPGRSSYASQLEALRNGGEFAAGGMQNEDGDQSDDADKNGTDHDSKAAS